MRSLSLIAVESIRYFKFFLFFALSSICASSFAVTWENFIQTALEKSPEVIQTRLRYEVTDLPLRRANLELDWRATIESGFERDRRLTMNNRVFDLDERNRTTATVGKSFLTGTDLFLDFISEDLDSTSTSVVASRDGYYNSYLLTLEQNLWRNAFGRQHRASMNAAKAESEALRTERLESLESSLLRGANLFWQTAVLERQYKESEAALKRYEKLVTEIERKNRNRYAVPGELAQVRAQYHGRVRQTRENRINYEQALLDLAVFLPDSKSTELGWNEKFPQFGVKLKSASHEISRTRAYKLAELRQEQFNFQAVSAESKNKAQVALVGKVGATGADESSSVSRRQLMEGSRPSWYVGVKWSHTFGSGVQDAEIRQARAQARAQEIATASEKEKLLFLKKQLESAIDSLEQSIKAQNEELKAHRQAVQELTRTYNQGRTDISILIEVINRAEAAEVEQVQTRADLELAYLQWQFLFDKIDLN